MKQKQIIALWKLTMTTTFLIHMLFLSFVDTNIRCPEFCKCVNIRAICSGHETTYIPLFPEHVTSVTILRSNITSLDENALLNLTLSPQVTRFNITDNGIANIHPNAFSRIAKLAVIIIQHERKLNATQLMTALARMNNSLLQTLYLSNSKWYGLPKDMFNQFMSKNIRYLHLTANRLYHLDCSIFSPLRKLKALYLTWNYIETIDLVGINKLTKLTLDFNHLLKVPQFCSSNGSLVPNLVYLKLSHNFIVEMNSSSFQCLKSLSHLLLDGIHLIRIESNTFANLPNLTSLSIGVACFSLMIIEEYAFTSSLLDTLSLAFAHFNFHGTSYHPRNIFAYSPNLIHLDLSGNNLKFVDTRLVIMLKPLKKLKTLIMSHVNLIRMPTYVFTELKSLKTLILDNNKINSWNDTEAIFRNNQITNLSLKSNLLTVINESSFSQNMWKSLLKLDLSFNPFSCTCDQMWFRDWIENGSYKLTNYPKSYICESPNNLKGVLLEDYRPTIESCTPWSPLFTVIIIVSSACGFVLVVIGIFCKCQINMKNRIYLFRVQLNKQNGYYRLENTEVDFEYDAFVVYCDADSEWVHSEFLKRMEVEEGMKLCIHHRDFDPGETIINNIDRYLRKSFKVVVILSNNYAKSDWCQWEIDVVQERRRRYGKNVFLLIMLKSIDSKHMTSSLRTLLESTPHITYQTGIGSKLFWKAAIETLRRPIGHPPTAVL